MWLAVMTMQAVAGPPVPAELRPVRPTPVARPCGSDAASGDIVVCSRSSDADRLPRLDGDRYAGRPLRAATTIAGAGVAVVAEQGTLPNGQTSPRAMLRLKLPF